MKKIQHLLVSLLSLLLVSFSLSAQNTITVKGRVTDAQGEPVIGAVVMLYGHNSVGASTDANGNYSLSIPASSAAKGQLSASCLGYTTEYKPIGKASVIDFVLEEDNERLDEVVVVGYGGVRRSDLTGSVTSVRIAEEDAAGSKSLDQLLQGHAAGVQVRNSSGVPDGNVAIRIRGITSLNGSNEPLYVVDGVLMTTTSNPTMMTKGNDNNISDEGVNSLLGLNPNDIASIEILKDASATAIYGAAGANGVILITTKTANRDRPTVSFNAGIDIARTYRKRDMLDFDGYVAFLETLRDCGRGKESNRSKANEILELIYDDPLTHSGRNYEPMDWQDYMTRTGIGQRWYFSIAGRPQDLSYNFSFGYNDTQGVVKNTSATQYTVRLNVDKHFSKKFTVGTKVSFAYVNSVSGQGLSATGHNSASSIIKSMVMTRPYFHPDEDDEDASDSGISASPDKWLTDFENTRDEYRVTPNIFAEYKILPWLTFKSSFGGDFRMTERAKYKAHTINHTSDGTTAATAESRILKWNNDNLLMFNKDFGGHNLSGTLGMTITSYSKNESVTETWNMPQYKLQHNNMNTAKNASFSYTEALSTGVSYFVRGIYNYRDRYVLTGTFRVDGSSKFQGKNKYATFPSFAGAWRLNQEPWFNVPVISQAKFRVGWGRVGNSAISEYQTLASYSSEVYGDHTPTNLSEFVRGLNPGSSSIPNPSLKWETTEQTNVGLDMGFWKGRLSFTVDAYYKNTFDLLQKINVPISSGFSTSWVNRGAISNRGLEISLSATPVKTRDFEWSLSGNISFNRNRIEDLGIDSEGSEVYITPDEKKSVVYYLGDTIGNSSYFKTEANIFMQGYPIGLFYGIKTDGIIQEGETGIPIEPNGEPLGPGSIKYVDVNGNGYLDWGDRTIIGDPNPKFTYGFSTEFDYKRFALSLDFNGSFGNDIANANLAQELDASRAEYNIRRDAFEKAWTPQNKSNVYPAVNGVGTTETQSYFTDRLLEDGSYLRLANVRLSYEVPLRKGGFVQGLNLGASLSNVWIWTKYSGWDPDVNSFGNSMTRVGIDIGSYPTARALSFDVRLTF